MKSRIVAVAAAAVAFGVAAVLTQLTFHHFDDDSIADDKVAASEWVTVTGDGYSVRSPKKPELSSQRVPTAAGDVETTTYTLAERADAVAISAVRAPGGTPIDLDGAVDGAASNTGTTVLSSVKTTLEGADARTFRLGGTYQGKDVTTFGTVVSNGQLMLMVQYTATVADLDAPPDLYQRIVDSVSFTD